MARYTVAWHKSAEDQLAEIWLEASDRQSVTRASDQIERELAIDAERKGAFVVLDIFEITVPPLCVYFRFSTLDRLVSVLYVKTA